MEVLILCAGKLCFAIDGVSLSTFPRILMLCEFRPDFDSPSIFGRLLDKDKGWSGASLVVSSQNTGDIKLPLIHLSRNELHKLPRILSYP